MLEFVFSYFRVLCFDNEVLLHMLYKKLIESSCGYLSRSVAEIQEKYALLVASSTQIVCCGWPCGSCLHTSGFCLFSPGFLVLKLKS